MEDFKAGDRVCWVSQSGGYEKRKEGTFVKILKPNEDLMKWVPQGTPVSHIKSQRFSSAGRGLVIVITGKKKRIVLFYTPLLNNLRLMERAKDMNGGLDDEMQ